MLTILGCYKYNKTNNVQGKGKKIFRVLKPGELFDHISGLKPDIIGLLSTPA
jgi:hypothetical protein